MSPDTDMMDAPSDHAYNLWCAVFDGQAILQSWLHVLNYNNNNNNTCGYSKIYIIIEIKIMN